MESRCCNLAGGPCTCASYGAAVSHDRRSETIPIHDLTVKRLGVIMEPLAGRDDEAEGVLNPAAVRGRDGALYLFPRLVAAGNFSRIGIARVMFEGKEPVCVERIGYALEPAADYERVGELGGCEDARVVFYPPLDLYIMTYTALGPTGPRVAVAVSRDLTVWQRRGLVRFDDVAEPYCTPFGAYNNKDAAVFPYPVPDPDGRLSLALLHRPGYDDGRGEGCYVPCGVGDPRASIWISYCPLDEIEDDLRGGLSVRHHRPIAGPEQDWESIRLGAGPPPAMTNWGWLAVYHGVSNEPGQAGDGSRGRVYQAGVMMLDPTDPGRVLCRSNRPILSPVEDDERLGVVPNVVFPTGLDMRYDFGCSRIDIYYGMADSRIGAASLTWAQNEKYTDI